MVPNWVSQYVGLEFEERGRGPHFDCWGLLRAIYREQFQIDLPSYAEDYRTTTDDQEIRALVQRESQDHWQALALDQIQVGDVLMFRMRAQPMHAGLCVGAPWFVHCTKGIGSAIERWDSSLWAHRITGAFRYRGVA